MLARYFVIFGFLFSTKSVAQICNENYASLISDMKQQCEYHEPSGCVYSSDTVVENHPLNVRTIRVRCLRECIGDAPDANPYYYSPGFVILCDGNFSVATQKTSRVHRSNKVCGSIVDIENRGVGESIPITGTSFSLNYFSEWSYGRPGEYTIQIPLVGDALRQDITSFDVIIKHNGAVVANSSYPNNQTNLTYSYVWDGSDGLGNPINGTKKFVASVIEHHSMVSVPITVELDLGGFRSKFFGLGSWLPSIFAFYDTNAKRLHKGDGTVRKVEAKAYGSNQLMVPEEDGSQVYIFDSTGKILYIKTRITGQNIFSFQYDSVGKLQSISEPFAKVTTFNKDLSGNLISITAPNGQQTTVTLDGNGLLSSIIDPNSNTYSMEYASANGLMISFEKPGGQANSFQYSQDGLLEKNSHSGGFFQELIQLANGQLTAEIKLMSAMGLETKFETAEDEGYSNRKKILPSGGQENITILSSSNTKTISDSRDGNYLSDTFVGDARFAGLAYIPQQISVQNASGFRGIDVVVNSSLNDVDDPFSINSWSESYSVSGTNTSVSINYDPSTKKFTSTTTLGQTSETTIDNYERVVGKKIGNLNAVSLSYTNEHLTSVVQGTRTTSLGYHSTTGNLQSITNPLSQTTSFVYDNANRVTSKILPDARAIGFGYDANGNVTSVTPPNRPAHYFSVNGHELVGSYAPPALSGVSVVNTLYSYNLDKQLTQVTRPDGAVIDYNYNATTGVLENFVTPDGTYTLTMDYSNGLPSSIVTADGYQTQISYAGRAMIGSTVYDSAWGMIGTYAPSFTNMLVQSDSVTGGDWNASQVNYAYDDDENLTGAGDLTLAYNVPNGQLTGTSITSGSNTITDVYTYNNYGEVTGYEAKLGTTTIYSLSLPRDASGRINGKTQTMSSTTDAFEYTFDLAGRLTETKKNSVVVATYAYDSNSNRNGGTIGSQPTTATYDDQDRLSTYNTLSFTYNANGDLLTKTNNTLSQTTQYVYDVFGNLKQVTLPNTTVISYEIDGLNRRVGRKVNGVIDRRWIYMDQYRIAAETDASGVITKRFVYGSKGNIPDYMISGGENYRIISDHLGSPRLVVKVSDGTIIHQMNHDEFGRVTQDTNPGYLPFGFAGGLYDTQTGLVRFGARDYDAEVGRWTSKDPILFNGGDTNLYGYVINDPVNFIDVDGKNPLVAMVLAPLIFEVSFDLTTFFSELKSGKKVKDAVKTVIQRSPLNNCLPSGVDMILGPVAPAFNAVLDPNLADTILKIKDHKKRNDEAGE